MSILPLLPAHKKNVKSPKRKPGHIAPNDRYITIHLKWIELRAEFAEFLLSGGKSQIAVVGQNF